MPVERCAATLAARARSRSSSRSATRYRHALLEAFRCAAETDAAEPRVRRTKRHERGRHGAVDDVEQIAGQRRIGVEAEEHVGRHHGVP